MIPKVGDVVRVRPVARNESWSYYRLDWDKKDGICRMVARVTCVRTLRIPGSVCAHMVDVKYKNGITRCYGVDSHGVRRAFGGAKYGEKLFELVNNRAPTCIPEGGE